MRFYWHGMIVSIIVAFTIQIMGFTLLLSGASQAANMLYGTGGAIIYGFYVMIDLRMIAEKIEIDDYILGAITLYLDLITLFIHILRIFGKIKEN